MFKYFLNTNVRDKNNEKKFTIARFPNDRCENVFHFWHGRQYGHDEVHVFSNSKQIGQKTNLNIHYITIKKIYHPFLLFSCCKLRKKVI